MTGKGWTTPFCGGGAGGRRRPPFVLSVVIAAAGLAMGPLFEVRPAEAQEVRVLGEEESVSIGLERNARVRAATADAAEADAAYREARGLRLPSLRSQAGYTRLGGDIPEATFTFPGLDSAFTLLPIELNRFQAELTLEQPIFTGGRLTNQVRAAAHDASAVEWLAEQERVDVAFEIRRAYWTLYGAIALRDAANTSLALVEEHLADVESRFANGTVLLSEVLGARTRRSEVLLDRVEAENAVRVSNLELSQAMGLPLDTEIRPSEEAGVEAIPADLASLRPDAAGVPPRINALTAQADALRALVRAQEGGWLPEVGFVGRYTYARPNPYALLEPDAFKGTWEAGLALQWGIWEGGQRSARTAQARERLRGAEARIEYARDESEVELARDFLEARRAAEAVAVAEENVAQAEESFRVVRLQFDEGVALSAQVLEAEEAYRAALARRGRGIADQAIARAALLRAAGAVR